jgi:regulator of sigma E protease
MEIINVIVIILEVLVLFNLLIIVHELGHFLAARWRGLVVERFGIWFGKPLWQKEYNGVTYCLGCIPAGGFVALPQMAPMEVIEGESRQTQEKLPEISVTDKIIVAFAGPLFSFLLALVFAVMIWVVGRPASQVDTTTVIGYVERGSPADKAGLKAGDQILEIDGNPVNRFRGIGDSIQWRIISSEGETIKVKVKRGNEVLAFEAVPHREETKAWERKALREIQIAPEQTPVVAAVIENSPAEVAGIRPNDIILKVNGQTLYSPRSLTNLIEATGLAPIAIEIQRGKEVLTLTVKPEVPIEPPDEKKPRLGIEYDSTGKLYLDHPNPIEQIYASVNSMVTTFAALLSPKSDVKAQHLSGPVGIMRIYFLLFQSEYGWRMALWFSVIFNVNLALLNLLPIPVLDGGHILLAIIEGVRRKAVNIKVLQHVQTACAVLIIGYMLYVTFFDVQDLSWKRGKQRPKIQFAPKPAQVQP